ncbi:hypothetical protein D3C76_1338250 [compost metagenome]
MTRRKHFGDRALAGFGNRSESFFNHVRQPTFFVARRRVGTAVGLPHIEIIVVPGHLFQQAFAHFFVNGARGEEVDRIAHFGHF